MVTLAMSTPMTAGRDFGNYLNLIPVNSQSLVKALPSPLVCIVVLTIFRHENVMVSTFVPLAEIWGELTRAPYPIFFYGQMFRPPKT